MSEVTDLDVRLPMGVMFALLGAVLAVYGLFAGPVTYVFDGKLERININLWWGLVIFVFGALMLLLARRARTRLVPPA